MPSFDQGRTASVTLRPGDDFLTVISAIPRIVIPKVANFYFYKYLPTPGVKQRLLMRLTNVPSKRSRFRDKSLPTDDLHCLWDYVTLISSTTKDVDAFFQTLLHHDPEAEVKSRFSLSAPELTRKRMEHELSSLPEGTVLAFSSRCDFEDGSEGHLPMIDFDCRPSDQNRNLVMAAIKALSQKRGGIFESGNSYHYCGFDALKDDEWQKFLARCLLLAPLVDARYVGHRLLSGACSLRISASCLKRQAPWLIKLLAEQCDD